MTNLGKMMQQAQQLQSKMAQMQEDLAAIEVTGSSGAGMVQVVMTAKNEARSVKIDPSLFSSEDAAVVEDLIVAAINDARAKAEAESAERMQELTGGLQLPPGMKLPS